MASPMDGIRVVEMRGADVVKIEPPGLGDPCRSFKRSFGTDVSRQPESALRFRQRPVSRILAS